MVQPDVGPPAHDWHIAEREYRRHEQRRGRRHAFEHLDPARTALVVVDMVPFFVGEPWFRRGIVGNINRLATALRAAGGTVAWVLPGDHEPLPAVRELYGDAVADAYRRSGGTGPLRSRLWPELAVAEPDLLVEKTAASAFFPGRCELPGLLEDRGVETVLVTGTITNVCCESTARDAATLGYRVVLVADGTATTDDAVHNATLHTVYRSFGDVRPTTEVLDLITSGAARPGRTG